MAFKIPFSKFFPSLQVTSCCFYRFCRSHSSLTASTSKRNNMYMVNEKGDNKVHIKILFSDESYNIQKNLTFERTLEQNLESFLQRFKMKVQILYQKKVNKKKQKKSQQSEETETVNIPEFEPCFLVNNEPLTGNVALKDFFEKMTDADLKVRIKDTEYPVLINAPIINNIRLPSELYVGTAVYPETFDTLCIDFDKSIFTWYLKQEDKSWSKCGEGFYYVPKEDEVGSLLKLHCLPVSHSLKEGLEENVISSSTIKPFHISPELKSRHELTKNLTNEDEIRIISYNILADTYVNTKQAKTVLFTYCENCFLDLKYRKTLWEIELCGYNADLICLQEMENKIFKNVFVPVLSVKGLEGVKIDKENRGVGCAFFYNSNKFKLLFSDEYYMHNEIKGNPAFKDLFSNIFNNEKLSKTINDTNTLMQIGALQCLKKEDEIIVFGNTHLPFCPDYDHLRLLYGVVGIKLLLMVSEDISKKHLGKNVSIILCGDFNSTPESGLHQFLNEGSVDSSHKDWRSREEEFIENLSCSHPLKLQSAYGFPPFTNYTELFKGCLDYIYFQTDRLKVKQIVPIPDESVLSQQTAIPSQYFPSDHVSLVADLKFKS